MQNCLGMDQYGLCKKEDEAMGGLKLETFISGKKSQNSGKIHSHSVPLCIYVVRIVKYPYRAANDRKPVG
jgi:hypothetical protein